MSFDYKKAQRWMKKQIKDLKDYVAKEPEVGFPAKSREDLVAYAAGRAHIGHASVGLMYLAGYQSAAGCLRVLNGDEAGFADIDIACLYNDWMIRLLACAYELDTRPDKQPRVMMENVATCWMHATALGATTIVDQLSDRIRRIDAGDGSIAGKDMNPLCALMAHFVTGKDAATLKRSGWASIGPYERVTTRSFDAHHYEELAQYHTGRLDGPDFPDFSYYPYCIVPFELLAIEKLTGVAIEAPKHPLLTSPLARRREVKEIPVPPELAGVIARAKVEFLIA